MNEHASALASLTQISQSFIANDNPSPQQMQDFRESVAAALLQGQPAEQLQAFLPYELVQPAAGTPLSDADRQALTDALQSAAGQSDAPGVRAFRRDTPFVDGQVRGSVPDWALGAKIGKTIGPMTDQFGRKVWWDFYYTVPGVQLFLQGSATPSLVLTVQESWWQSIFSHDRDHAIPASSIWINTRLLCAAAPDTEYCGLTLKGGNIHFTNPVTVNNGKMIVPPGTVVTLTLDLAQPVDASVSPDETGADARDAKLDLPKTLKISFSASGSQILEAGAADWTVYGQPDTFTFDASKTAFYLAGSHRVCIPYRSEQTSFDAAGAQSKIYLVRGVAPVVQSSWSLLSAAIDVAHPLEAQGIGGMLLQAGPGLSASWIGLKDAHLLQKAWVILREAWILLDPGHLSVFDLSADATGANGRYNLWKGASGRWNFIDLHYTNATFFFYNCFQSGLESVLSTTDCIGAVDKPVNVAGRPFELKSKQTFSLISWSKALRLATLYDDNLLVDNKDDQPYTRIIRFQPQAIALNNALLTVSPVTGFYMAGALASADPAVETAPDAPSFTSALLIESFGLLAYLPTLPDPYAADLAPFANRYMEYERYIKEGGVPIQAIQQLLVGAMNWKDDESPKVNFSWGNIPSATPNQPPTVVTPVAGTQASPYAGFDLNADKDVAYERSMQREERQKALTVQSYRAAGVPDQPAALSDLGSLQSDSGRGFQNRTLFTLLDVSTNADLLGVDVGFMNDEYIFQHTYKVQPTDPAANSLAIRGMDVVASSRFVRIFTLPQISWEPLLNITKPFNPTNDPPFGVLRYDDDGFPALIGNTGIKPVTVAPIPITKEVVEQYKTDTDFKAWSIFTLPNGMVALARYNQVNAYKPSPNTEGATIELIHALFENGASVGYQISTKAGENPDQNNRVFEGLTFQNFNVKPVFGTGVWSPLGKTVTDIFNNEFYKFPPIVRGIPVERYDFTGYGAQVFSAWLNEKAAIAETSKAIFDVWRGRTAKEVIQVRSLIYPWGIRVVRTVTMYRASTGFEYRVDSGWRADSDGVYDFKTKDEPTVDYTFHPGLVRGVFSVQNIVENDLAPYKKIWHKNIGKYVDPNTGLTVNVPAGGIDLEVDLRPVYFDADVMVTDIEGTVKSSGVPKGGFTPGKKMLGYLQVAPRGIIIRPEDFAELLDLQNGLGGPVDCTVNVNGSGQKMRVHRVEVNHSLDDASKLVFVTAAKGMPVLPKDGSWSLVTHDKNSKKVTPLTDTAVALIRKGVLGSAEDVLNSAFPKEIAATSELFKKAEDRLTQYGFLQNTDAQKVLYRNPFFQAGENLLHSTMPDLGDAYHTLNSKGVFPDLSNLPSIDLDAKGCATKIIDQGYQMVDKAATGVLKSLEQDFPTNANFVFIDKPKILKVYVEYAATKPDKSVVAGGKLQFDLNSEVNKWVNKMNDVTMVVDLVGMERLFLIQGKFDTQKGAAPEFKGPKLVPGKDLKPIVDILELLEVIGTSGDYAAIAKKGLQILFSNSPNNWEYKFQADKEIPVLQFPPAYADGPTTPLRLEANMKLGVYFNLAVPIPPTGLPGLGAGAFIEFGAKLQVMCVSLALATVYAVGQITLRISADTVKGPGLYMKMGFGIELMVGIPVVGNVSVLYAVGIEISLDTKDITVAAFLLFRGRAELFGGLVTITIQIEASGKIHKSLSGPDRRTDCIAQVTFSIDVSVFLVLDFHDTERWQETRQIA